MPYFSGDSEGEALSDWLDAMSPPDDDDDDDDGLLRIPHRRLTHKSFAATVSKDNLVAAYATAKAVKTGQPCTCPICGKVFTKKSYQQAFCSNKGARNCKDLYWNRAEPERAFRATLFTKRR